VARLAALEFLGGVRIPTKSRAFRGNVARGPVPRWLIFCARRMGGQSLAALLARERRMLWPVRSIRYAL
jgi:hypothetical protein